MALDLEELRRAARGGARRPPRLRSVPPPAPAPAPPSPSAAEEGWTWKSWLGLFMIGVFLYRCASGGDKPTDPPVEAPAAAPVDAAQRPARPSGERARPRSDAAAAAAAPPPLLDPEPPSPGPRLAVEDDLQDGISRLPTQAGVLRIVRVGGAQRLELDGAPLDGPGGAAIRLVHRAAFADREVVTGFSGCRSASSACRPDRPFFVLMRAGAGARVLQAEGIAVTDGFGAVDADATGVGVDLGIHRGTQWRATLTARDGIHVDARPARLRALDDAQCAQVSLALRGCSVTDASSCAVPGASAAQLPAARRSALTDLFDTTTGFNQRGFLALCSAACTERAAPSPGRVFAEACSGAEPAQWSTPSLPWLPGAPPVVAPTDAARGEAAADGDTGAGGAAPPAMDEPAGPSPRLDVARSPSTDDFYPPSARRAGIEGAAVVDLCVDTSGRVEGDPTIRVGSGADALDEGAVRWARQARFMPATRDGQPVPGCTAVRVRFKLAD